MRTQSIPQTDSIEELARFWETHDLADFDDELEEVTEAVFVRGQETTIRIHLPQQDLEIIKWLAKTRGVGYTALIREWVLEKLRAA